MKKSLTHPKFVLPVLGLALSLPAAAHAAAIEYGTAGAAYIQNFNSLAASGSNAWTNGTTITGWHAINESGAAPTTYAANAGAASGGNFLSLGTGTETDRAFGAQNSNAVRTLYYGAQIVNTTGDTLDAFTLVYTGEQWRAIGNESQDKLTFQYQIFAAGTGSLTAATGWNNVADLDFNAPIFHDGVENINTSSTTLNGNLAANRVVGIEATVTGLVWAEGQEIWLRWADNNPVNNSAVIDGSRRAIMGIDDVSFLAFSTVPEPSSYAAIFGVMSLGFAACKRRRKGASENA